MVSVQFSLKMCIAALNC